MTHPMPGSVRVGAVTWRVVCDPDDWMRTEHQRRRSGDYGCTESRAATIHLNPEQAPSMMRLTMWHEMLHALAETAMGSPDWHHLGRSKEDREEAVVRAWEHPILAVLRDNPELVAYLTGADA